MTDPKRIPPIELEGEPIPATGPYVIRDVAEDGSVVLDFNRAYNPPCAFTPFATCPLPPPGNRIDLAVTAGEKAYSNPVY